MLRFLTYRVLAAVPVLFVMSVVTFGIIHATPGDYADYVATMLRTQGHASNEVAAAAANAGLPRFAGVAGCAVAQTMSCCLR
jgi:peptide/nickel transport system permease protein